MPRFCYYIPPIFPFTLNFLQHKVAIKYQNRKIDTFLFNSYFQTLKSTVHQMIVCSYHETSTGLIHKYCILSRASA